MGLNIQKSLLIGVGKRENDPAQMAITASDASRLSDELQKRCKVPAEHIILLSDGRASKDNIIQALDILIENSKEESIDLFWFYFSGHGIKIRGDSNVQQHYIVCNDTVDSNLLETSISGEFLVKKLNEINAEKVIVLLDCCYAGGINSNEKVSVSSIPFEPQNLINKDRVVISASHSDQVSFLSEPVSLFTFAIIEGLAGKDLKESETSVKIFDLAMYVRERVYPLSRRKQQPQLSVLSESRSSNFVIATLPLERPINELVFGESFKLITEKGDTINVDIKNEQPKDDTQRDYYYQLTQNYYKNEYNIEVKEISVDTVIFNIGGESHKVNNSVDNLLELLKQYLNFNIKIGQSYYPVEGVSDFNIDYILKSAFYNKNFNKTTYSNSDLPPLMRSLNRKLQKDGLHVNDDPGKVVDYYGWLVGEFLRKLLTKEGRKKSFRRLYLLLETYHTSLRYLCFIQIAQYFKLGAPSKLDKIKSFLSLTVEDYFKYDFIDLFITLTNSFVKEESFVPEIHDLVNDFKNNTDDLLNKILYIKTVRDEILNGSDISEADIEIVLNSCELCLLSWLRRISFIAKYKLISVKEISLNYQLNTDKEFIHFYGELNSAYQKHNDSDISKKRDRFSIQEKYAFSRSILLFRDRSTKKDAIANEYVNSDYLSLSPFMIDQSSFIKNHAQTPELYYFSGRAGDKFRFSFFRNELDVHEQQQQQDYLFISELNDRSEQFDEFFDNFSGLINSLKGSNGEQ